jgi:hypothetical protein
MSWRRLKEHAKTIIEDKAMRQRVGDAATRAGEASARSAKRLTALGVRLQSDATISNDPIATGDPQTSTTTPAHDPDTPISVTTS